LTFETFFPQIAKGIILCKLINFNFESTIDNSKINLNPKNTFEQNENHDLAINAAKSLGCTVVNIGGKDITDKVVHLVMGLLWQIIKISVLKNVKANASLIHDQIEGVEKDLPPELILLHWFNHHLDLAHYSKKVKDFGEGISNSEAYVALLHQLAPELCSLQDVERVLKEEDLEKRADKLLDIANRLGCRQFVTPKDIIDGNPRLNLAFVATIFNKYPGLGPTKEQIALEKISKLETELNQVKESTSQLESERQALILEKSQLQTSITESQAQFTNEKDQWETEKTQLQTQIQQIQEQTTQELKKAKEESEQELAKEKENFLQQLTQAKEAAALELKKTRDHAIEVMKQAEVEIGELRSENTDLSAELAQLRLELKQKDLKIKKLEDIIVLLKEQMKESLTAKENEKIQALEKAEEEKNRALIEAKKQKEAELAQLSNLMTGSQRAGWLWKEKHGFKPKPWHKRYFVLKDNLLAWYRDELGARNTRASGFLQVEKYRLHLIDEKDRKKSWSFELIDEADGKVIHLAATTEGDYKLWIQDLQSAKSKKLASAALKK